MFQYKILEIFDKKYKIKMILMFLLMFFVSFVELLSIGSILPIFTIIFNQEYLLKVNNFFSDIDTINIKFDSHDKLIFFSLTVFFLVFTLTIFILVYLVNI